MKLPADQTELVAAANHALRTPLTVIAGYADLLLEDAANLTPEQREWLERITANTGRLEDAIEAVVAVLAAG
jgi:signal transduction histidine kinase